MEQEHLGRLPSHGLAVAQWFRQNKSTRRAPLVFVEGATDKVAKTRTPLAKKLGIGAQARVALLGAPRDFEATLSRLPAGVTLHRQARGTPDIVVLFALSRTVLDRRFATAAHGLAPRGKLWIAWPKKTSGLQSDLSEAAVRDFGLERDFVDYKICAIDATWSGLCVARRRKI